MIARPLAAPPEAPLRVGPPAPPNATPHPPHLVGTRVRMLPATRGAMRLHLRAPQAFLSALRIEQAPDWGELGYEAWAPRLLENMGAARTEVGWWLWWLTERSSERHAPDRLVGHVGFKGPPSPGGTVELAFGIVPSARRQGLASEGVMALVHWAFQTGRVRRVIATVAPTHTASLGVLRKLGFRCVEEAGDAGYLLFSLERR